MKIPEPTECASGEYRIQLRLNGKSIVVKDYDKNTCIAKALAYKYGVIKKEREPDNMTLSEAMDKYIEARQPPICSPATIRGYKKIKKMCFTDLMETKLKQLTQKNIQSEVNKMAKTKSPKYVSNAHGLLSSVLKEYRPDFRLATALPSKRKPNINLPNDNDIKNIINAVKGTRTEIPILMALWMGMRLSEIRGATFDCIKDHCLHINKAIVEDENFKPVEKQTKTYSSDRWVRIPQYIEALIDALPEPHEGYIVNMTGCAIRCAFYKIQEKAGLPHCSIHALRHANAAVMLKLNIPNKYAQERGGWSTDNVLKNIYQYTMSEESIKIDASVNAYFEGLQGE